MLRQVNSQMSQHAMKRPSQARKCRAAVRTFSGLCWFLLVGPLFSRTSWTCPNQPLEFGLWAHLLKVHSGRLGQSQVNVAVFATVNYAPSVQRLRVTSNDLDARCERQSPGARRGQCYVHQALVTSVGVRQLETGETSEFWWRVTDGEMLRRRK